MASTMRFSTMQISKKLSYLSKTSMSELQRQVSIHTALRFASVFSPDEGVLFETRDTAPSPSRDYYQLKVGTNKVSLIRWCISNALSHPNPAPSEESYSFEEFLFEVKFHEAIVKLFGQATLDHTERIVLGEWDFLPRVPVSALQNICLMLDLKDLVSLSLTSKKMLELCSTDKLWEILYHRDSSQAATADDVKVVKKIGWKKVFFINNRDMVESLFKHNQRRQSSGSLRLQASKAPKGKKKATTNNKISRTSVSSIKRYY